MAPIGYVRMKRHVFDLWTRSGMTATPVVKSHSKGPRPTQRDLNVNLSN
jgi:hypothetical protein